MVRLRTLTPSIEVRILGGHPDFPRQRPNRFIRTHASATRLGYGIAMTEEEEKKLTRRRFYKAEQEASFAEAQAASTLQTESASYKLAYRDTDFLLRDELRPVRFQLELLKPEMLLEEANIGSTLVVYGSARIPSPEH